MRRLLLAAVPLPFAASAQEAPAPDTEAVRPGSEPRFSTARLPVPVEGITPADLDDTFTDLREHRDRARALALDAAREKAEAMAGRLGQRIGSPLSITESGSWWPSRRGGAMSQNVVAGGGPPPESTDSALSPGQVPVHASVRVTFELISQ